MQAAMIYRGAVTMTAGAHLRRCTRFPHGITIHPLPPENIPRTMYPNVTVIELTPLRSQQRDTQVRKQSLQPFAVETDQLLIVQCYHVSIPLLPCIHFYITSLPLWPSIGCSLTCSWAWCSLTSATSAYRDVIDRDKIDRIDCDTKLCKMVYT